MEKSKKSKNKTVEEAATSQKNKDEVPESFKMPSISEMLADMRKGIMKKRNLKKDSTQAQMNKAPGILLEDTSSEESGGEQFVDEDFEFSDSDVEYTQIQKVTKNANNTTDQTNSKTREETKTDSEDESEKSSSKNDSSSDEYEVNDESDEEPAAKENKGVKVVTINGKPRVQFDN